MCPYHKLATVACTRRFNVPAGDGGQDLAILWAKSWLLQGHRLGRKRDHAAYDPRHHELLPAEVVELQVLVVRAPPTKANLKTDQQLDEDEAAVAAGPAEAAAVPPAEAAAVPPGSEVSSSSTSSSSSSSESSDSES